MPKAKPLPGPKSKTADKILDRAETLIQTRGYSAFSYQDISEVLGIRKASIHYHFESKTDLGVAVIDRYAADFEQALKRIAADETVSSLAMLDYYAEPYLKFAETPDRVCLSGALAGEIMALPPVLRERLDRFFKTHHAWLAAILKRGAARGEFELPASAVKTARAIFGALQGALLVKRVTGDTAQMKDVLSVIKLQLASAQRSQTKRSG